MKRQELIQKIEEHRIDPDSYSLFGANYDERYALHQKPFGEWAVYYSEKGLRTGERAFKMEDEACSYILSALLEDPLVRKR